MPAYLDLPTKHVCMHHTGSGFANRAELLQPWPQGQLGREEGRGTSEDPEVERVQRDSRPCNLCCHCDPSHRVPYGNYATLIISGSKNTCKTKCLGRT